MVISSNQERNRQIKVALDRRHHHSQAHLQELQTGLQSRMAAAFKMRTPSTPGGALPCAN